MSAPEPARGPALEPSPEQPRERRREALRDALRPVRMQRIALTAGLEDLRAALIRVGEDGCVQIDAEPTEASGSAVSAGAGHADGVGGVGGVGGGARDQVDQYTNAAARHAGAAALTGWCPVDDLPRLTARLHGIGGAVVALPAPPGVEPPTLLRESSATHRSFSVLVRSYGTVPYADCDPTLPVGIVYMLMFGVMFGDAGHGALVVASALVLRSGRIAALARIRHLWRFVAGAGVAATAAGLAYGEFFGPTTVVPVLWLDPLDQPLRLTGYAIGLGVALLAGAYALGTVNRWREGGPSAALYAASGAAGSAVFAGGATVALGVFTKSQSVSIAGAVCAGLGLVAAGVGLAAGAPAGVAGGFQVGIGLLDLVTRIGSNVLSFARLAAFGLTHAALGLVVWQGVTALARRGPLALAGAVLVFAVGNAAAIALEGLVVAVQALRLEYYELFSRIFAAEGRPFRPFRLSARTPEAVP
ncbi:hypothetical protein KGA66_22815 [Actinocrinis puniceicyclus]|uniref:V-type ATP synthase subunit I n=1 Tax=Actinocrinis puniceicyclus TaxID=977794 RepID=A0A8J7WVF7_9ACTN|nr:V-type ATPase 116kDa subunit family protein [Actinocrinis puniceicyclus]MBS2965899.1 hypothetical protein [Actinocrinis puniceicyclus]